MTDTKTCDGCGKPITLDDDLFRPAGALLHAQAACAAAWLEKQKAMPPERKE